MSAISACVTKRGEAQCCCARSLAITAHNSGVTEIVSPAKWFCTAIKTWSIFLGKKAVKSSTYGSKVYVMSPRLSAPRFP